MAKVIALELGYSVAMPATYVATREIALSELKGFPGNARRGDTQAIKASLEANGQYRSLIVREIDGDLVVLAGNHTLEALAASGSRTARCEVIRCTDTEATRINLVDNRTTDLGDYDHAALSALLSDVAREDAELLGTGYSSFDLDDLLAEMNRAPAAVYEVARQASVQEGHTKTGKRRTMPIDLILTTTGQPTLTKIALGVGWHYGGISDRMVDRMALLQQNFPRIPPPMFLDCEWHDFDPDLHLKSVKQLRPKYATVRDVLTREQAREAGVEWYPLEQILEWAEETQESAENVIIIPKYDCIDKIPEQYVLGYSVWTSYGGTELPIEEFAGHRVHLLGGSWKKQRAYLNILGDDVVSLDNNHLMRVAQFGTWYGVDGNDHNIDDIYGPRPNGARANNFYPAVCLSLTSISTYVMDVLGTNVVSPDVETDLDLAAHLMEENR